MAKNRKRTCWVLQMDWELYGDRDTQVELFSSLHKAQKRMSEWIKDDITHYIDRFGSFEYDDLDDEGNTIKNKIPIEVLRKDSEPLNTKWAMFFDEYDSDYITYSITKKEIK